MSGSPGGLAVIVHGPPELDSMSGPSGNPNAPSGAFEPKPLATAPTATHVAGAVQDTPYSPVAPSLARGMGFVTVDHLPLVIVSTIGPGPVSCPTATHDVAATQEIPLRPRAPYVGVGPPEPGLDVTVQLPLLRDSTKVLLEPDVAWYPVAMHAVRLVHATERRPPCDPRFGVGITDQTPPAKVRVSGSSVEESPPSVFPTATQLVGVAHETP